MAVDVLTDTVIRRPIGAVAAYAANPDHVRDWYVNIKEVEWKTTPPVVVGSQVAFVAHFLGRRLAYTYEVVELVPGERLVMRTSEGPFPMETTYTWEATPEGFTRMTLRNRGTPRGFSRVMAPFMAWAMRRANQKDVGSSQRSVQFWSVSMANKSSIVSDLHGWRTPSVSGEELQAPGKSGPQ